MSDDRGEPTLKSPDDLRSQPASSGHGCWSVALILVGALIALVSGLCASASIVGGVLDLMDGAAPLWNILQVTLMYVLVSAPFLAGGIALIVWGLRLQRRK